MSKYVDILNAVKNNIKTNLKINTTTIPQYLGYRDAFNTVNSVKVEGLGDMINGASVQLMPAQNLLSTINYMRKSLGEDTITSLNSDITTLQSLGKGDGASRTIPTVTSTTTGQQPVTSTINEDGSTKKIATKTSSSTSETSSETN